MEGIGIVCMIIDTDHGIVKEFIINLSALREKIICLFGTTACQMYGLIPDKPS